MNKNKDEDSLIFIIIAILTILVTLMLCQLVKSNVDYIITTTKGLAGYSCCYYISKIIV